MKRRTRTAYWRPARIQGDSVRRKLMSADWFCVFSWVNRYQHQNETCKNHKVTHDHEDSSVLALAAPVLRGEPGVADPVGLYPCQDEAKKINQDGGLTLMPQRKGVTAVPTTGSWLIAMISLFMRISSVWFVTLVSCYRGFVSGAMQGRRGDGAHVSADVVES